MRRYLFLLLGSILALVAAPAAAQQQVAAMGRDVSVALVLAVDVSTSIDHHRFQLQREGYANAFTHPAVIDAIRRSPHGRIAVTLVEWAGVDDQRVVVPWTEVGDEEGGQILADRLLGAPRPFDGWTSISGAIDFSVRLFDASPYRAARLVIDVSGDGINNSGRQPSLARDAALARDITINGLVIMANPPADAHEQPLDAFYRDNVVGGPGAFVLAIDDFDSFAYAIVDKMVREVAGLPPGTRLALDRRDFRIAGEGTPFRPTVPTIEAAAAPR